MAALGTSNLTLVDIAKRWDPDGKPARIAEMLSQTNAAMDDIPWQEGNLPTGHRTTVRTGLPTVAWRLLNAGVSPSKSTTAQSTEACGILEAWSEVDIDVANLNGNAEATRLSEAKAFIEAMSQEFVGTLFYGNSGLAPEEFTGLSVRYSSLGAVNAQNIVSGGGAGSDNSSIWLVCWSPDSIFGIYPRGSKAGLAHNNLGEQVVEATSGISGSRLLAYRDRWQWQCGICLKDWRQAVRIPNIDISALVAKSSAADLFDLMIKASHRIINPNMGRCVWYMNRTTFQMLDIQGRDDVQSGGQLKYENVDGRVIPTFRGWPIRVVDQLTEAEAAVV